MRHALVIVSGLAVVAVAGCGGNGGPAEVDGRFHGSPVKLVVAAISSITSDGTTLTLFSAERDCAARPATTTTTLQLRLVSRVVAGGVGLGVYPLVANDAGGAGLDTFAVATYYVFDSGLNSHPTLLTVGSVDLTGGGHGIAGQLDVRNDDGTVALSGSFDATDGC